jgi:hypothetical protein
VARLAVGANADHYLRWRLRNLHVQPRDAELAAAAWSRGGTAPVITAELRAAPRRALEASSRLDLVHATLRGTPATATEADRAHVRGDSVAALSAYREEVVLDPGDDAAWAGLALHGGEAMLRDAPEVVAAVHRALGDPQVDPLALARWLSS